MEYESLYSKAASCVLSFKEIYSGNDKIENINSGKLHVIGISSK
jgi:hypothetical protein